MEIVISRSTVSKPAGGVETSKLGSEKQKIAEENGADLSIGYDNLKEKLKDISAGKGIDVIFDPVGGDTFDTIARTMARKGRLLVIDIKSGKTISTLKIDKDKISRPFVSNQNLYLVKDNAIIRLN